MPNPPPNPSQNSPTPTPSLPQLVLDQLALAQQQLDSVKEQLAESQRLATIGTIAAVIAHEFNNLLTPIVSYSQFALQSAKGPTPDMELICKALSKAFASADKAGKISSAMLALPWMIGRKKFTQGLPTPGEPTVADSIHVP